MNCKNCQTQLKPNSDFCNTCGGKVIRNRLTIKNLFEHISETFFNYDNKLLRTIIDLFKKPEVVIGGYIDGVRKQYVNPISYFGIALTLSGLYLLFVTKFYPEAMDFSILTPPSQEEMQKRNMSVVQEYQSLFMMFYVPIYALIARITFVGLKKFNYSEILVIFIYTQAQISITSAFSTVVLVMCGLTHGVISLIMLPLMIIYNAFVLRRLYQLSMGTMIVRTLLFFVVLGVVFVIASILMAIMMFINGDFEQMMEAKKAAKEVTLAFY